MGIRDTSDEQKKQPKQLNLDPTLVEIFNKATVSPIVQFYIFTNITGRNVDLFGTENLVNQHKCFAHDDSGVDPRKRLKLLKQTYEISTRHGI